MTKYNIGFSFGNNQIIDWDKKKGVYVIECSCGKISSGTATYINKRLKRFEVNKYSACVNCSNNLKKQFSKEEDDFKVVFNSYKRRAKNINKPFLLSLNDVKKLITDDCHYCGDSCKNSRINSKKERIYYNGIDRINSNEGYTITNTLPCCKLCNYSKHTQSYEEFLERIKKIYLKNVQRLSSSEEYTQVSGNGKCPF